jgi:peptide/nickel transport system substrate-binding protein
MGDPDERFSSPTSDDTDDPFRLRLTRADFVRGSAVAGLAIGIGAPQVHAATLFSTARPKRGGRLRVAQVGGGSAETLDPGRQLFLIDTGRTINLFDGLSVPNPDGSVKLALAQSMEPNRKGDKWQITLRKGVTFHNGRPLTVDDVLYTIRRNVRGNLAGGPLLEPIQLNASRRVTSQKLILTLKRPLADLPRLFNSFLLVIVQDGATDFHKPIGTGPFQFVSFRPGQRSVFTRNANYWDGDRPYVDTLEMISIPDNTARLNALLANQVDAIDVVDIVQAKAHAHDSSIRIVTVASNTCTPFYMRVDRAPFKDERVRLAFKLAIDRPKTVGVALQEFGLVGNDVFGKDVPGYDARLPQHKYDPDRAKALLKKAGQEGLAVTLITSTLAPGMLESATAFAEEAKKAGIRVNLKQVPGDDLFNTSLYYLKVPFSSTSWTHLSWEENVLQSSLHNSPFNETHWNRPQWEHDFRRAQGILDKHARYEKFHELQHIQWAEGGYLIWGVAKLIDAVGAKVRGVIPSPYAALGRFNFANFWFSS